MIHNYEFVPSLVRATGYGSPVTAIRCSGVAFPRMVAASLCRTATRWHRGTVRKRRRLLPTWSSEFGEPEASPPADRAVCRRSTRRALSRQSALTLSKSVRGMAFVCRHAHVGSDAGRLVKREMARRGTTSCDERSPVERPIEFAVTDSSRLARISRVPRTLGLSPPL
jgi:hypothetical protein